MRKTRDSALACVATIALLLGACGTKQKPIDRVGVNVVDKAVFQDSWYMARTVIDVDYEGSALGTFPGDAASDAAQSFTAMPRIRWVIDEKYLFAYRDYDLTLGGDGEAKSPAVPKPSDKPGDVMGQPVAAFKVEKHFDIRRDYNPSTGEELNVIVENDTDHRWYERKFMRVDWSKNLLPGYYGQTYDLNELLGSWKREPADIYVQKASSFPSSWQPRFDRMVCTSSKDTSATCKAGERDFADDYSPGELYHMSFVTQELLSPSTVPDPQTGADINWCTGVRYSDAPACTSVASYVRTSFLKVSDKRQYEPVNWVDTRFDRFGFFRLEQATRDRSTGKPDDPAYFSTDFLNYNVNRHNIWKQWFDKSGQPLAYKDRKVRQVVWYTTPELPAHLVRPALDVVGQWNEVLMSTVRRLRGQALPSYPDVDCQTTDPDGYCYCQQDPRTNTVIRPTCPGQYDPFTPSDAYGAKVTDAYDCWVEAPKGAEPNMDDPKLGDKDFNGWFDAHFVGSECVSVLRVNGCNQRSIAANKGTAEGLECQERGDLRYKFLSYVDQPGTGFLGIATLRGDPVTGEVLTGDANVGGPALDQFRTTALLTYDLVHGTVSENDIVAGDDVRSYFENLGRVELPARPRTDFSVAIEGGSSAMSASGKAEIDNRMQLAMQRINRLKGPEGLANTFSGRSKSLIGTALEKQLNSGPEALVAAGVSQLSPGDTPEITDAMLDKISPFRNDIQQQLAQVTQSQNKLARANVELPNEYVDNSVQSFVSKHLDWPRARLELGLNRLLYRQTVLHELGHCLGMRHDFGASADSQHYAPEYYEIVKRLPLPDPADYDKDGTAGLSADEQLKFDAAYDKTRADRELAGIDGAMSSSVMEYTSNWYERIQPLGLYDKAAIANVYGDLVEAYAGPVAASTPRDVFKMYDGGEACGSDADCPYAASGARGSFLLDSNMQASLTQHCVANPRGTADKVCSSFDNDLAAQAQQAGSGAQHQPLTYRFCSDERADTTLAWCNRFDEGASYREMVRNVEEDYERMYPFAAFRRYRRTFDIVTYRDALLGRRLNVLQNVYQNLLFEYTSDPNFRNQEGAFGFYDQFLATTDILNFYAKVLSQPNIGGYVYDPQTSNYQRGYIDAGAQQADLPVPFGLGRYFNSDYQTGLSGIERIERVGSFFDKVWVIQMLSTRGQQATYTRDVAFYANFYDLFPEEMQQIFNGMIRGFPEAYMPRVKCEAGATFPKCKQPQLVYMDFYRGDCSKKETCKPNPAEVTYAGLPVLDGGGSLSLQIYAASYGLQDFPVFFDTSFQNQLFMCIEGQGDCFKPDPAAVEGVDYVRYTSDRYSKSFLAFQLEAGVGSGSQTSTGFAMIKEARDSNAILAVLTKLRTVQPAYAVDKLAQSDRDLLATLAYTVPDSALQIEAEITRFNDRISNLESFFNEMIQIQRDYQIQSFQYFK